MKLPSLTSFPRLAFLSFVLAAAPALAATPRPNILLVCVDDLKPLLGAYGDRVVKTPHIDRLAAGGVTFDRAYCNQAVCSPSRNALMVGLRPTSLGIYDLSTNFRDAAPDAVTLSQYFARHGYRAEALGKIYHRGHGNRDDPGSWTAPTWNPRGGQYNLPENQAPQTQTQRNAPVENADVPDLAYADGMIAEEAVRRLRAAAAKPGEPYFLAVGFIKPHLPFCAPRKYWDLYDRAAFALPALTTAPKGAPGYAAAPWGELRAYRGIPRTGPLDEAQQRELIHGYHAAVSYLDAQLGVVLAELDRSGLAANTIVLLWGDHGWHLGDHGQWCKHTNYEQAARIPLIVRAPGLARGAHSPALVETVDIYPTLAELAGLPVPAVPQRLDGRSFAAALRAPDTRTKEAIFHAYPRGRPGDGPIIGRAVRTDRHRLVEWKKPGAAPATAELELYDYTADPLETENLAARQPEVVARLRAILATQPEALPQIRNPAADAPAVKKKRGAGKQKD